jgi:hypothetical protein
MNSWHIVVCCWWFWIWSGCVSTAGHNVCEKVLLQYVSVNRIWFYILTILPVMDLTWYPYTLCQIYCIAGWVYIFQQYWTHHKSYMFWALLGNYIYLNSYVCWLEWKVFWGEFVKCNGIQTQNFNFKDATQYAHSSFGHRMLPFSGQNM